MSHAGVRPLSGGTAGRLQAPVQDATSTARMFTQLEHGAAAGRLAGDKLFLQHGPINLVITIDGQHDVRQRAEARLVKTFPHWLEALVKVLPALRTRAPVQLPQPTDPIAAAMTAAVRPYASSGITPMAAVAGAIADAAVTVIAYEPGVERALVNNGGDIALHLPGGAACNIGLVSDAQTGAIGATVKIDSSTPVRGIATSGWRGRSHSLGIADAVTVLAASAATADAAATAIASATNAHHAAIKRAPVNSLDDDSDLDDRLVTTNVGTLDAATCEEALANGVQLAHSAFEQGHIHAAALCVQGHWRFIGTALNGVTSLPSPCADARQSNPPK